MAIVIEVDGKFQGRPGIWRDGTQTRVWWGFFAVTLIREPYHEWVTRPKTWVGK